MLHNSYELDRIHFFFFFGLLKDLNWFNGIKKGKKNRKKNKNKNFFFAINMNSFQIIYIYILYIFF